MDYTKAITTTEYVYYYDRDAARNRLVPHGASSETSSENMTNDSYSCWMISVIQALRGSDTFRKEFAPVKNEKNTLKKKLFELFDISEGKNGKKRRAVSRSEIRKFKRLVIKEGLNAPMDRGYFEKPFLKFLLQKLDTKLVEYTYGSKKTKHRETIFTIPLDKSDKPRSLQTLINKDKVAFLSKSKTPKFLPIYLSRPLEKREYGHKSQSEASRTPVTLSYTIEIPVADGSKARYRLVSVVIGRDSAAHAYSYVFEKDAKNKPIWVEYNEDIRIHKDPETKKRRTNSNHTPYDDVVKHGLLFMYEFTGYA